MSNLIIPISCSGTVFIQTRFETNYKENIATENDIGQSIITLYAEFINFSFLVPFFGFLYFHAGEYEKTVPIQIIGDDEEENHEIFYTDILRYFNTVLKSLSIKVILEFRIQNQKEVFASFLQAVLDVDVFLWMRQLLTR